MLKLRRFSFFCLLGIIVALTACVGTPPKESTATLEPPVVAAPNSPSDELKTVRVGLHMSQWNPLMLEREVNRLLEEQGVSQRIAIQWVEASSMEEFLNATLGGGELPRDGAAEEVVTPVDIFPSSWPFEDYAAFAQNDRLMDITTLLLQFPDLLALNDQAVWEEGMIDGRSFWIPLTRSLPQARSSTFDLIVDQSVLTLLDLPFPQTYEEMAAILREARAKDLPYKLLCSTSAPPYVLHRTYDEWPFFVDRDSLFVFYADGSMEPYVESDIFQKDAALLQALDREGLVEWLDWGDMSISNPSEQSVAMGGVLASPGIPYENIAMMPLAPEKPGVRIEPLATGALFVSRDCEDPYTAMALIDAIYKNDKILLTLAYGMEGVDWALGDDGKVVQLDENALPLDASFLDYGRLFPYLPIPEHAAIDHEGVDQSYPFSGFRFFETMYRNEGFYFKPPLAQPMLDALAKMYDLRRGNIPMSEMSTVKEELDSSEFQQFYQEELMRYQAFLAR